MSSSKGVQLLGWREAAATSVWWGSKGPALSTSPGTPCGQCKCKLLIFCDEIKSHITAWLGFSPRVDRGARCEALSRFKRRICLKVDLSGAGMMLNLTRAKEARFVCRVYRVCIGLTESCLLNPKELTLWPGY